MALDPGTMLGPYEIVGALGAGGMGEVYRANDTRLDRTVAIKVLPSHLAADDGLRKRFEQEARAISSLNHPHICTLHDIGSENGVDFIVMEHLEGETLAQRLKKGPLPLDSAIRCGVEIAGALHDAHRRGIVHRDLKPGNVMLTQSGSKLLDFGLAKPGTSSKVDGDFGSAVATEAKPLTDKGTILGTFQYMSPEQLEGKDADARADVFALGAVLFEMLTGRKAFTGDSQASLIAAIMGSEPPPVSELSSLSPPSLDRVVRQCLTKDREQRFQSAHDVTLLLGSIDGADADRERTAPRAELARLGVAVAATALITAFAVWSATGPSADRDDMPKYFSIELDSVERFADSGALIVLPDGTGFVYSASIDGVRRLFRRTWNSRESEPIEGTLGAREPFLSPDGAWVGFRADAQLKKVPVDGGQAVVVCDAPNLRGAVWGGDDTIVFGNRTSTLLSVPASGGVPTPITTLDSTRGELEHLDPVFSPREDAVLFTVRTNVPAAQVAILDLRSGEHRFVTDGASPHLLPTGHLLYGSDFSGPLLAMPFDVDRLEPAGEPIPVLEDVAQDPWGNAQADVGPDGTLVYVTGERAESTLVWVDRNGQATTATDEIAMFRYPHLSPDGQRAVVSIQSDTGIDLWVYDLERGAKTRITHDGRNVYPLWSPDGERIFFYSNVALSSVAADGSRAPETIGDFESEELVYSITPDGQAIAFGDSRVVSLLRFGEDPVRLIDSEANVNGVAFSPDGRWLAYVSDESGRDEVYVQPYPNAERRWTISTDGGQAPLWSPQLPELYYRDGQRVMVVGVETEPVFSAATPQLLFEGDFSPPASGGNPYYDVTPDGQRFLMLSRSGRARVRVVLNWLDELERLVPIED